jgi:predicted  nucleic acid-binding Zn-ribbon protein
MPHECVECGEVFDDGADEVFDGCPDCGATKFFYVKEVPEDEPEKDGPDAPPAEEPEPASAPAESTAQTRARNETHNPEEETEEDEKADPWSEDVDEVSTKTDATTAETTTTTETPTSHETTETTPTQDTKTTDDDIVEAESEYEKSFGGKLDDTNGETTSDEAKPEPDQLTTSGGTKFRRARPEEARRRLMEQFETIRIVEPGSYELNLMNLYEEDEKIIALQEDGRYQVSLPSTIDD